MDLDISDYIAIRKVVSTEQDKIHFEDPKNILEETWDNLSLHFTKKIEEEFRKVNLESEMYKHVVAARVEAETVRNTYDIINNNVLKVYPVAPTHFQRYECKPYILKSCLGIISTGLSQFMEALKKERLIWKNVGNLKNIKLDNGEIRVRINSDNYLTINEDGSLPENKHWRPKGISCIVKYRRYKFMASIKAETYGNTFDEITEFYKEQSVKAVVEKGDIKIEVTDYMSVDSDDDICLFIVDALKKGVGKDEILRITTLYMSRYVLDRHLERYTKVCFVISDDGLEDGCSRVFYVVADNDIFKVDRSTVGKVKIFLNELAIDT